MDYRHELTVARAAARAAGQAVLEARAGTVNVARKDDASPVTSADLESNRILTETLLGAFPEDGWLSEETADAPARLDKSRCWVVDPIDGTKEFIQGIPEFCISVALVVGDRPVVGVVHNPSTNQTWHALVGGGAFLDDRPIACRASVGQTLQLAVSRSEVGKGKWAPWADRVDLRPAGSAAFKLALVASGEVDATFTLAPRNEWDIAAGVLLVAEAGGSCADRAGEPLAFNQRDPLKSGIFAAGPAAKAGALALLAETRGV
jgi:myo-inositol-1(or 4)-monophosphatase